MLLSNFLHVYYFFAKPKNLNFSKSCQDKGLPSDHLWQTVGGAV